MSEHDETATGPMFRPNKRRKVFRKRVDVDDEAVPDDATSTETVVTQPGSPGPAESTLQFQRRQPPRKHGVVFTSVEKSQKQELEPEGEMALTRMHPSREQIIDQSDRFVKPTGKVAVVDDKHMMAFVDSKLAEIRDTASIPTSQTNSTAGEDHHSTEIGESVPGSQRVAGEGVQDFRYGTGRKDASSAAPSSKDLKPSSRQHTGSRRSVLTRDPSGIARDSLVDQIMRESAVPLYDRSTSGTPLFASNGMDNDAAAAEAFKAQFLVEAEQHKRRKPLAPPAGTKGAVTTSHGPKLGGSRSQREKMKAAEEAKTGKKK